MAVINLNNIAVIVIGGDNMRKMIVDGDVVWPLDAAELPQSVVFTVGPGDFLNVGVLAGEALYVDGVLAHIFPSDFSGNISDLLPDDALTHQVILVTNGITNSRLLNGDRLLSVDKYPSLAVGGFQHGNYITDGHSPNLVSVPEIAPIQTQMTNMFQGATSFNSDISNWDVSLVTDMWSMFQGATSFNGDISNWNVSSVTRMASMFYGATSFNGDMPNWNVSSVTNIAYMFNGATSFNGDISNWDVSSVTQMSSVFNGAASFNSDISNWNVSSVTNMDYMFQGAASFNSNISNWDVSSVTSMLSMFYGATSFNSDISNWDVSSVTNMTGMFRDAVNFNQNLSYWDVEHIPTQPSFFDTNTPAWVLPKPLWGQPLDVATLPQSVVFTVGPGTNMFVGVNVGEQLYVDGVLTHTFDAATGFYDISPNIPDDNEEHLIVVVTTGTRTRLVGGNRLLRVVKYALREDGSGAGTYRHGDVSLNRQSPNLTQVPIVAPKQANMSSMFEGATSFNQDLSAWDVSSVTDMSTMFYGAASFNQDLSGWDVSSVTNMTSMFRNAVNFNQNLSYWDVEHIPTQPSFFDTNTPAWVLPKPLWGQPPNT